MSGANYTRVWEIHSLLHPKPDDLISTSRFFVREGELQIWDDKKRRKRRRYFFLFNDILLLTKRESHKRYWLRIHITLRSPYVSIEQPDSASYTFEFRLHCRSRSFILYAPTSDLKKEWVDGLLKSISGGHKEELDNKKLQEMTKELHKDVEAEVVKETQKDPSEKREKRPKKKTVEKSEEEEEEEKETNPKSNRSKNVQRAVTTVDVPVQHKKRNPKKEKEADLIGPMEFFDPFSKTATLSVPSTNHAAHIIQSSPGQFGNVTANPFATSPQMTSPFGGDIFGGSSNVSQYTGSLAGTQSLSMVPTSSPFGGPFAGGVKLGQQGINPAYTSSMSGSAAFGSQSTPFSSQGSVGVFGNTGNPTASAGFGGSVNPFASGGTTPFGASSNPNPFAATPFNQQQLQQTIQQQQLQQQQQQQLQQQQLQQQQLQQQQLQQQQLQQQQQQQQQLQQQQQQQQLLQQQQQQQLQQQQQQLQLQQQQMQQQSQQIQGGNPFGFSAAAGIGMSNPNPFGPAQTFSSPFGAQQQQVPGSNPLFNF